ncbi:cancer/testis antigen 55-like [Castor canadensis]|uniref:Cancer/testis antigen 55-like n=1 Tax=Castor canadensis TaxID=51338 RepID=A0AC58LMD2_CASCN
MHRLISRARAFFGRRADSEAEREQHRTLLEDTPLIPSPKEPAHKDDSKLKTVQGVVTSSCSNYGWIDDSIFFNINIVTGKVPLKVGQKVIAVVEEDETSHELAAIKVRVDAFCDEPSDTRVDVSPDTLTSAVGDFEPYHGDLVEVEFSIQPGTQNRKAISVKPLAHKHVNEVCITSIHGRHGVVDNAIFFTLDSLKLPPGYVPQLHDLVNVVIVESAQSCYTWRAVSMTPVQMSQ